MERKQWWLSLGLALTTFATLLLEILSTRLLSVLTWYHLSFLAISLAMLGMASGAVLVFLGGDAFRGTRAIRALGRYALAMAVAIPIAHLFTLAIPLPTIADSRVVSFLPLSVFVLALGFPFFLSGVVVTLALTRTGGPVGRLYAFDLLGAAAGCLLVIPLLIRTDLSTAVLSAGAITALSAWCFARFAGGRGRGAIALTLALAALTTANARSEAGLEVLYPKNQGLWLAKDLDLTAWNTHSYVTLRRPEDGPAFYWGGGRGADQFKARMAWLAIDGEAGTPITQWDGRLESLEWVKYDVTSLPYHLRRGDAAIIGVGGGRDVLSALWGRSASVTGIEINGTLIGLLQGRYRDFARIADREDVQLVHDEARSLLTRTDRRFDVIQMSLIDTWAATGAGAFTLSENGLYTHEAWRTFLSRLKPRGVFSVSRWFNPTAVSETSRMLALAVSVLLERGVRQPARHVLLVSSGAVATLLVSPDPFEDADLEALRGVVDTYGFRILLAPGEPAAHPRLGLILSCRTPGELARATQDPNYDFSPPTDERPFFFNMLKLSSLTDLEGVPRAGVVGGNMRATVTLAALFVLTFGLVLAIIVVPLVRSGLPGLPASTFAVAVAYFATIGLGFMFIQIPFLQRFSVYLGHPTYTFAIILFAMILFTGAGSYLSDRAAIAARWLPFLPVALAVLLLVIIGLLQPAIDTTIQWRLPARSLVVLAFTAPLSVLLGFCFPIGMRLVGTLSDHTTAWMWGINGASGVLASVAAVGISMWAGIHVNLWIAAGLYLALAVALTWLRRRALAAAPAV